MEFPKCVLIVLILAIPEKITADQAGQSVFDSNANLSPNAVPMMGKKDAAPREVPSFTSGYLPPAFPQYMRARPSKRDAKPSRTSWHLGKRQRNNFINLPANYPRSMMSGLATPTDSEATKRSATPTEWNSPWDNMLRSSQGFRFHEGGSDLLNRHLIYKRTPAETDQEATFSDVDSFPNVGHEYEYADYGGLMDDVSLVSSA